MFGFNICKFKKIRFGNFTANQFVLFEHKKLFSIIFFYFKGEGWQDRWHTHAFNAISFKIFGDYLEWELITREQAFYYPRQGLETGSPISDLVGMVNLRDQFIRYFPRDSYHKLGYSDGCLTMLLSGPWQKQWKEIRDDQEKEYSLNWSRKENV